MPRAREESAIRQFEAEATLVSQRAEFSRFLINAVAFAKEGGANLIEYSGPLSTGHCSEGIISSNIRALTTVADPANRSLHLIEEQVIHSSNRRYHSRDVWLMRGAFNIDEPRNSTLVSFGGVSYRGDSADLKLKTPLGEVRDKQALENLIVITNRVLSASDIENYKFGPIE